MIDLRIVVLCFAIVGTGCSSITDSLEIGQPLSQAALGAEHHLSVVIQRTDPDFDAADEDKFWNMLSTELQGVAGSITRGASSSATAQLLVDINEYESTTTMGRFWFGVMAGPAIFQAALTLTAPGLDAPLSRGQARANSTGWGIVAGTNTQTYPAVARHVAAFLRQTPR
jgi:hypothetical protein